MSRLDIPIIPDGYREIPGVSGHAINLDGRLLSCIVGNKMTENWHLRRPSSRREEGDGEDRRKSLCDLPSSPLCGSAWYNVRMADGRHKPMLASEMITLAFRRNSAELSDEEICERGCPCLECDRDPRANPKLKAECSVFKTCDALLRWYRAERMELRRKCGLR